MALAVFSAVVSVAGLVALRSSGPVAPELEEELDEDDDELLELLDDELEEDELLDDELTAGVVAIDEIDRADVLPAESNAVTT